MIKHDSRKMNWGEIVTAVGVERGFQDEKHGLISDYPHTIGEWIIIMETELAEAKLALIKGGTGRNHVMHEILQVVATGFAALEQHGLESELEPMTATEVRNRLLKRGTST